MEETDGPQKLPKLKTLTVLFFFRWFVILFTCSVTHQYPRLGAINVVVTGIIVVTTTAVSIPVSASLWALRLRSTWLLFRLYAMTVTLFGRE